MPRATTTKTSPSRLSDILVSSLNKTAKDEVASTRGGVAEVVDWISTRSFAVNTAIGRPGIPVGRLIVLQGVPSGGKTALATSIGAECQARGGSVVLLDAEYAFDAAYAAGHGLYNEVEMEKRGLSGFEPLIVAEPLHIRGTFQMIEHAIIAFRETSPTELLLFIWDSVAGTMSSAEFDADYDNKQPGTVAREMSGGLKKLVRVLSKYQATLIIINQEKEKIGGMPFADNSTTIADKPLHFHASVKIVVRKNGLIGEKGHSVGQRAKIKVVKNKVAPPMREANFSLLYGSGVDNNSDMLEIAIEWKIVQKGAGGYCHMTGSQEKWRASDFAKSNDYAEVCARLNKEADKRRLEALGTWDANAHDDEEEELERFLDGDEEEEEE